MSKKVIKKNTLEYWELKDNLLKIEEWIAKGITRKDCAKNMGITRSTLWTWENKSQDISNALREGDKVQVEIAVSSLIKRANGYNYEEHEYRYDEDGNKYPHRTFLKHMPADVNANKYFLNNRSNGEFSDKVQIEDVEGTKLLEQIRDGLKEKAK